MRSAARSPFILQLADAAVAVPAFEADALVARPWRPNEARWLIECSVRLRLPSRVLVVDDSSTMRAIVRKTLSATRFLFEISEASEGMSALALAHDAAFDIVFLDYNMPGFDGLETLAKLKHEGSDLTVVMMTLTQKDDLAERARVLGATFLKKPFFPADIEAALSDFYGLRALNSKRA